MQKKEDEPVSGVGATALRQATAPRLRELSLGDLKRLLEAFRIAAARADVQAALEEVRQSGFGAFKKRASVARVLADAWKKPIKDIGLAADGFAFPLILAAVRQHAQQPGVRTLSEEVERQLRFIPGSLFGTKAGEMKQPEPLSAAPPGAALAPPEAPQAPVVRKRPLNLGEVKELLKSYKEVCSNPDFQSSLDRLWRRGPEQCGKALPGLLGVVWGSTLELLDFPNTKEAHQQIFADVAKHQWNVHVKAGAHEVERLVRLPEGALFGIPGEGSSDVDEAKSFWHAAAAAPEAPAAAPARRDEVEVLVTHAVQGTSLTVKVGKGACFSDVKEAIAAVTDSTDIFTKGKLVRKTDSGMYAAFKDSDPIGDLRQIQVLGADLTMSARARDAATAEMARAAAAAAAATSGGGRVLPQGSAAARLTLQQAVSLQEELHEGFKQRHFQAKLEELEAAHGGMARFHKLRSDLCLTVQGPILVRYGFSADQRGVYDMLEAFGPYNNVPQVVDKGIEINRLLHLDRPQPAAVKQQPTRGYGGAAAATANSAPRGAAAAGYKLQSMDSSMVTSDAQQRARAAGLAGVEDNGSPGGTEVPVAAAEPRPPPAVKVAEPPPPPPPREVLITIRREEEEVAIKAWTDWTLQQVRDTLARELKHDELRKKLCFVVSEGGRQLFLDTDVVGDREVLLATGVDSLRPLAQRVDLVVQHAVEGEQEVRLPVWSDWTFGQVKEVLALQCGQDDIRKRGRFVFKAGLNDGSWMAFKDPEQVGNRQKISFLGMDLPWRGAVQPAPTVEVAVKHIKTREALQVLVPSIASIRDVREAMAQHLGGRRDISREGRLVQPQGDSHAAFEETALVGERRRLLFDGPSFSNGTAAAAASPGTAPTPPAEVAPPVASAGNGEPPLALTPEGARELLCQIRAACSDVEVQQKAADPLQLGDAFLTACAAPASKAGFGSGEEALERMLVALRPHVLDGSVQEQLGAIEALLGLPAGSVAAMIPAS